MRDGSLFKRTRAMASKTTSTGAAFILSLLISMTHFETHAGESCNSIFNAPSKSGSLFLIERDPKLHTSNLVERTSRREARHRGQPILKPVDKVSAWITKLEEISKNLKNSPIALKKVQSLFHKQYVMKSSDVPESYYALQARLARERGHGDVEITKDQKDSLANTIVIDQKKSLDNWIEYFVSAEASVYPMWVKVWMLNGVTKLSKFDAENGSFGTRGRETIAPFPELNAEAVSLVVELIIKKIDKGAMKQIADPSLIRLVDGANFGKLYGYALKSLGVGSKSFTTNQGIWIKYPQGSDPTALVNSLEGKNTGWCTGGLETARSQLEKGDFHVYYSQDSGGQPTHPRLAIRMEGPSVGEIRGIAKDQNFDSQIIRTDILEKRLTEMGISAKEYNDKSEAMALLTTIDRKQQTGIALNKEELVFLYEIKKEIEGFGHMKDPRISEIRLKRDQVKDLNFIFSEQLEFLGHINLEGLPSVDGLSLPRTVKGNVVLGGFSNAKGLKLPDQVEGYLHLKDLEILDGVTFPRKITKGLYLDNIVTLIELVIPKEYTGEVNLDSLKNAGRLVFPKEFRDKISLKSLESIAGVELPEKMSGALVLSALKSAKDLKIPDITDGYLFLDGLSSADGLILPKTLNGSLSLGVQSAQGLRLPDVLRGDLVMLRLEDASGLILPREINGSLDFSRLKSAPGLKFPEVVNGSITMNKLNDASGIAFPKNLKGAFMAPNLVDGSGLILPESIGDVLFLRNLSSAKGVKMPKNIKEIRYVGPEDF